MTSCLAVRVAGRAVVLHLAEDVGEEAGVGTGGPHHPALVQQVRQNLRGRTLTPIPGVSWHRCSDWSAVSVSIRCLETLQLDGGGCSRPRLDVGQPLECLHHVAGHGVVQPGLVPGQQAAAVQADQLQRGRVPVQPGSDRHSVHRTAVWSPGQQGGESSPDLRPLLQAQLPLGGGAVALLPGDQQLLRLNIPEPRQPHQLHSSGLHRNQPLLQRISTKLV